MAKKVHFPHIQPNAEHGKLNRILTLQRQNDIIQLVLEGKERKEIAKYVVNKYNVTSSTAGTCISQAVGLIKDRTNFEVNTLISLHVQRYEQIYAGLYEIHAYGLAMSALKAKEKLLGFHKEGFHMRVNNGELTSVQLQSVNSDYDVMKLDRKRRDRMSALLNKAKADTAVEKQRARRIKQNGGVPKKMGRPVTKNKKS